MKNSFITLEAAVLQNCRVGGRNGIDPAFPSSAVTRIVMLFFFFFFFSKRSFSAHLLVRQDTQPTFKLNMRKIRRRD